MHYQTNIYLPLIQRLAAENAVVIFSKSTCCMCHAIKKLFSGMGVNATVYELGEDPRGKEMEKALVWLLGVPVPAVFVGGKLVGAVDKVMTSHINGTPCASLERGWCYLALTIDIPADFSLS